MIGIFGGSFDPIHHGHLLVAQAVVETLGLEELRFIPAREQPFKRGQHLASAELRAQMVSLAIAGEPRFRLERAELEREGPSYTVDTLRELHRREPGAEFGLLIGADAAVDFPSWRESDEVARLAMLIVFARPGVEPPQLPPGGQLVRVPAVDISATGIRERVAKGQSIRFWVPDPVAESIAVTGLYLRHA